MGFASQFISNYSQQNKKFAKYCKRCISLHYIVVSQYFAHRSGSLCYAPNAKCCILECENREKLIEKINEIAKSSEEKIGFINKFAGWLDSKVEKHKGQIEKYGYLGVVLFVGIPIPGTGAWTGSLIASVLEMDRKKTFLAIIVGVAIACVIMSLFSFGLLANIVG